MSVAIRLSRAGRIHLPYYHVGVFNTRTRRDGRPVEELGFYNPKSDKEPVRINIERVKYWLSVGAKPSVTVATILKAQGVAIEELTAKKKAAKPEAKKKKAVAVAKKAAAKKKAGVKPRQKARTASSKVRGEKARKTA